MTRIILISLLITTTLSSCAQENKLDNKTESTELVFDEINLAGISPTAKQVNETLEKCGLLQVCVKNNIDQLDRDRIFKFTAILPFEKFKDKNIIDISKRTFGEVFAERALKIFWLEAREIIREMNEK